MSHPELTADYDPVVLQDFLVYYVRNLRYLCFYLNLRIGRRYVFPALGGETLIQQSMNLISIATDNHELGELVFQIAYYWVHDVKFKSQVLIEQGISDQVLIYYRELKNKEPKSQGDEENLKKVKVILIAILGEDFTDSLRAFSNSGKIHPNVERKYFEHSYAMLIGVGEYADTKISALPATVRDVLALGDVLRDQSRCGYREEHVNIATGPAASRNAILGGLDWLANKCSGDPEATAIFYFSGHGWKNTMATPQQYYLLPYDFDWKNPDESGVNSDLFTQKVSAIQAKKLVVILDSCYAGGMSKDAEFVSKGLVESAPSTAKLVKTLERLGTGGGKVIISSSREGEQSYVLNGQLRSVFTECLIQALSGKATGQDPKMIGIMDVYSYLGHHVPILAVNECGYKAQQHPVMDAVKAETFPIALRPARV